MASRQAPRQATNGTAWTDGELKEMRKLVKENTPTRVMALKLGRSEGSIRSKAQREGISLQPANRSPYNRQR